MINNLFYYISAGKSVKYLNLDKTTAVCENWLGQPCPKSSFQWFTVKTMANSVEKTSRSTGGQKLSISQQSHAFVKKNKTQSESINESIVRK